MATIEKRSAKQWRVKVRKRGYPEQSKSFTTKSAASRWARKIESEMDDGSFVSRRESKSLSGHPLSSVSLTPSDYSQDHQTSPKTEIDSEQCSGRSVVGLFALADLLRP